jgi:hypothetical protein
MGKKNRGKTAAGRSGKGWETATDDRRHGGETATDDRRHGGETATDDRRHDDLAYSAYDGVNHSVRRGEILWFTPDTRKELDSFSRYELQKRIRWLFINVGFLRGLVRNSATLVG